MDQVSSLLEKFQAACEELAWYWYWEQAEGEYEEGEWEATKERLEDKIKVIKEALLNLYQTK